MEIITSLLSISLNETIFAEVLRIIVSWTIHETTKILSHTADHTQKENEYKIFFTKHSSNG